MLNKNKIEIIYPRIMVFRNAISNINEIIDQLSKFSKWDPWYDIGEQIIFNSMMSHRFNEFPTRKEWETSFLQLQNKLDPKSLENLINTFEDIFFETTKYYTEHYHCNKPNWVHYGSNILRYEGRLPKANELTGENKVTPDQTDAERKTCYNTTKGEAGGTKEMTLPFHTDFYQRDEFIPGPKAEYTVTIYLNDDYEGGEIDFRIFDGPETKTRIINGELVSTDPNYGEIPSVIYKPKAGDLIIFPSRPPFYHGVRRVTKGTKYFVRMFWMSELGEVE